MAIAEGQDKLRSDQRVFSTHRLRVAAKMEHPTAGMAEIASQTEGLLQGCRHASTLEQETSSP